MYIHFRLNDDLTYSYDSRKVFFTVALLILLTMFLPIMAILTGPLFLTVLVMIAIEKIDISTSKDAIF